MWCAVGCMEFRRVCCGLSWRWALATCCVFFFKQKTAYEMRISDWSSDVCSSDLAWRSSGPPDGATINPLRQSTAPFAPNANVSNGWKSAHCVALELGRASCRERVCQYV